MIINGRMIEKANVLIAATVLQFKRFRSVFWHKHLDLGNVPLTLSWQRSLSYRNQYNDLLLLYDSDLRHQRIKYVDYKI